jgi:hypothetical protein
VAARVCRPQRESTLSKPRKGRCAGRPGRQSGEGWHDGTDEQCSAARCRAGVVAAACTQGKRRQHGKPRRVVERKINRQPMREGSGAVGWRRGSYYCGSRVTPMEGRSPGSRRMQEATREPRLGQPYKTRAGSDVAKCMPCGSEGRTRTLLFEEPVRPATGGLGGCETGHERWSRVRALSCCTIVIGTRDLPWAKA